MNVEPLSTRKPKPSYEGRNGFLKGPTEPEQIDDSNLYEALDQHRRALYVINHKQTPIPTLEEMQAEIDKPDDSGHISERIKALQEDHLKDLERVYSFHAQDYKQEVLDRYLSLEEGQGGEDDGSKNLTAAETRFQEIYNDAWKDQATEIEWQDEYEAIRYTYITQLLALTKQRNQVEIQEEEMRKRREQMFPISFEDFNGKAKDIQLRAARFLVADNTKQEKMLSEFGWAWRQVQPLKDIFVKDQAFAAHVRAMVLAERSVRDPRISKTLGAA